MDVRIASLLVLATSSVGTAHAGPFDLPDPQAYARAEDQELARLLRTPCTEEDVGRGCDRNGAGVTRKLPCTYRVAPGALASLPTDRCYKMEGPRRYRGVWVDEFEGQRFVPEGASPPEPSRNNPATFEGREQAERAWLGSIWIDARTIDRQPRQQGTRRRIEFVGRKTMYPGPHGHLGMFGQEVIVDRVISLQDCPATKPCR